MLHLPLESSRGLAATKRALAAFTMSQSPGAPNHQMMPWPRESSRGPAATKRAGNPQRVIAPATRELQEHQVLRLLNVSSSRSTKCCACRRVELREMS